MKSLICSPKACRGVAFGQEFSVYSRVYLPNATPLQGTFATFQTPSNADKAIAHRANLI
ncbi:MAG: hypothetical protein HC878_16825 [Leptolyngbyaceae cyanobacterium SL_5_14]|nr:hypothetical protein [Leptolyngbyaceae cyanobacterium SL_5_14]